MLGALLAVSGWFVTSSIIVGLICGGLGYYIGEKKGRGVIGLILGLVLSVLGVVITLLIPAKQDAPGGYAEPPPAPS